MPSKKIKLEKLTLSQRLDREAARLASLIEPDVSKQDVVIVVVMRRTKRESKFVPGMATINKAMLVGVLPNVKERNSEWLKS